jgi:hypothetical protein
VIKEGLKDGANLDEPRVSRAGQNLDVNADLLKSIEVFSERLKQLDNKEATNRAVRRFI